MTRTTHFSPPCRSLWLIGLVAGVLLATSVQAENWPQWRGPAGTGVSQERDIPLVWSESRSLAWKCQLPGWGASSPVVWKDAIFVTGQSDKGELLLLRIATDSGKIVWQKVIGQAAVPRKGPPRGEQKFHDLHNLASPSPVTDGTYVVAHFGNGDMAGFHLDGEQLWKINLQESYGKYTNWYGHSNSPVLYKNYVISVCMQDSLADVEGAQQAESYLVAHDLFSGRERWRTSRVTRAKAEQSDSYTTPLLIEVDGRMQLIVMGGNQLDAYDPATGKQLWFLPNLTGGRTVTGVTYAQEMLFATRGLRGATFGMSLSAATSGEVPRRDLSWERADSSPDSCSPVAWNELLFTVTDDGFVRCLHAKTGNTRWKHRVPGNYKASPIVVEGRLYLQNTDGLCTILSAAPYYDKLVENQLNDQFLASPAVSQGGLYLRGKQALYAIRK